MQVQELDYIQHLLLWSLYSRTQDLILKGGTALRLVYGGNRYSEDLDFNGPNDVTALQALWEEVAPVCVLRGRLEGRRRSVEVSPVSESDEAKSQSSHP